MGQAGRRERAGVGVLAAVAAVRRTVRGAGAVARVAPGGLVEGHRFERPIFWACNWKAFQARGLRSPSRRAVWWRRLRLLREGRPRQTQRVAVTTFA